MKSLINIPTLRTYFIEMLFVCREGKNSRLSRQTTNIIVIFHHITLKTKKVCFCPSITFLKEDMDPYEFVYNDSVFKFMWHHYKYISMIYGDSKYEQ